MPRGINPELFSPDRRTRRGGPFRIGYVGRLSTEKNVRFLVDLEKELLQQGLTTFEFYIVGQGSDGPWLQERMQHAQFPGVLRGDELTRAYADMDIFVFPSSTDTFGNVVLEALASGVPCVVTSSGGPKFIVHDGETGFVTSTERDFVAAVARMMMESDLRKRMSASARQVALGYSWAAVFDRVYAGYHSALVQPRYKTTKRAFSQRSISPESTI
jgi:glycosyltransferase involved in cell wall biosynthesis